MHLVDLSHRRQSAHEANEGLKGSLVSEGDKGAVSEWGTLVLLLLYRTPQATVCPGLTLLMDRARAGFAAL